MHVLESDIFARLHLLDWLDGQELTDLEWLALYSLIWEFLEEQPQWLDSSSWSEIRLAAECREITAENSGIQW
jgi:hypothetical protein